jgi:tetrahydromethanopterin S-methyltransferase subunit G
MLLSVTVTARHTWTDQRLDDLNTKVDKGFEQVDRRFEQVDRRFEKVEAEIRELRSEMNSRFDSMQRTMVGGFVGMTASIVGAILVTQL